ncbi:MAG: DUF4339 domain-containing protein [Thermoguttaceae bacterium]|jgi:hypothetical protein
MGIRCHCPNGHKLNVKTEQAGKIGICPKCGVRFQIPLESTRISRSQRQEASDLAENATRPAGQDAPLEMSPPNETLSAAPAAKPDAWYIQGGDGREYGPVTLGVIRNWIAEHRVAASTLVWKEGSSEKKEARNVFPEFATAPPPIPTSAPSGPVVDEMDALRRAAQHTQESSLQKKTRLNKKRNTRRDLYIVIGLTVVIMILLGILIMLLLGGGDETKNTSSPKTKATVTLVLVGSQTTPLVTFN